MRARPYAVRLAAARDARRLARTHAQVWHEAYASVMSDEVLDTMSEERLAGSWQTRLEVDEPEAIVAVAVEDGSGDIVGFASGGPTRDADAPTDWELYAINVVEAWHGTGVAQDLIERAVGERAATLWVLEDNPRAQAFYRRNGFEPEGGRKVHAASGLPEIRMVRR